MKILAQIIFPVLVCLAVFSCKNNESVAKVVSEEQASNPISIHTLSAEPLMSEDAIKLDKYKGKVMLVVNVASKCGLTPQYEDLQALHKEMASDGLAILGFPSNDFMSQEPGSEEEIASFCKKNYGVEFDMFEKVKVKGEKHPVYAFLTEKEKNGVLDSKVSWNFQKYLLDKNGNLITKFSPNTKVTDEEVRTEIKRLLAE